MARKSDRRSNGKDIISTPKIENSKRIVPIPDFLVQELQEYLNQQYMLNPRDRLFPFAKHSLLTKCSVTVRILM